MTRPKSTRCYHLPAAQMILMSLMLMTLGLTGCATVPMNPDQQEQKLAEDIYSLGRDALKEGNYRQASNHFKSLEIYYPDSPYNHQAQMELAYAYFKSADYDSTIAITNRLLRDFPNNDNHDYPRYLKALASFEQAVVLIEADSNHKTTLLATKTSLRYFEELNSYFPDSKYQKDAEKRVNYLEEQLAQYEIALARQQIEQGNHASAIIHARNVVENYPHTRSAADALAIVDMGYEFLAISKPDNSAQALPNLPISIPAAISNAIPIVTASLHHDKEPTPEKTMATKASKDNTTLLSGAHTISWIMQQPPSHFTIQLISTLKKDALHLFIKQHNLVDRVAYYHKLVNGKTRHTLIYGVYTNADEARSAISELPKTLRNSQPWMQRIKAIQTAIDNFTNNN